MLKWRYSAEEIGRPDQLGYTADTREGPECRCCSTAHADLTKKYQHLRANTNFRDRFIRALLEDKRRSLKLLEDVLREFSVLDKEILLVQLEVTREKEENEKLKSELESWKRKCADLRARELILQDQVRMLKSSNRHQSRHINSPIKDTEAVTRDTISSVGMVRNYRVGHQNISKFDSWYVSSALAQPSDMSFSMKNTAGFISGCGSEELSPKQTHAFQRPTSSSKASFLKRILWRLKFKRKK